jgi:hypothetical protein
MIVEEDVLYTRCDGRLGENATINLLQPRFDSIGNRVDGRRSERNNHQGRRRTWKIRIGDTTITLKHKRARATRSRRLGTSLNDGR